jgi:hypothetical protein
MADGDASTCGFGEFSSQWRTGSSHLRGGSENRTVVHNSTPGRDCPAVGGSGNRVRRATWCCSLFRVIGTVKGWQRTTHRHSRRGGKLSRPTRASSSTHLKTVNSCPTTPGTGWPASEPMPPPDECRRAVDTPALLARRADPHYITVTVISRRGAQLWCAPEPSAHCMDNRHYPCLMADFASDESTRALTSLPSDRR